MPATSSDGEDTNSEVAQMLVETALMVLLTWRIRLVSTSVTVRRGDSSLLADFEIDGMSVMNVREPFCEQPIQLSVTRCQLGCKLEGASNSVEARVWFEEHFEKVTIGLGT